VGSMAACGGDDDEDDDFKASFSLFLTGGPRPSTHIGFM
jgi:hypothetical protein